MRIFRLKSMKSGFLKFKYFERNKYWDKSEYNIWSTDLIKFKNKSFKGQVYFWVDKKGQYYFW